MPFFFPEKYTTGPLLLFYNDQVFSRFLLCLNLIIGIFLTSQCLGMLSMLQHYSKYIL